MITVKSGSYTQEELRLLSALFAEMERTILKNHCNDGRCIICPHRHICDDVHSVNEYLSNK